MQPLVSTERLNLAGVPTLHVFPINLKGPAPTVLFYHGWASRKENHLLVAEALACRGFRTILPDQPRHGERDAFAQHHSPEAWLHFWPITLQAIDEAARVATEVVRLGLAEPGRLGVAGSSAGGMVAAALMAREPGIKAGVLLNNCPCFTWLDQLGLNAPPLTGEMAERLRAYDPEEFISQMAPRPLLMLHGTADTSLPIDGVRRFAELARPYYEAHPERLVLGELPRLNHWVTIGMVEQMRSWFEQYV